MRVFAVCHRVPYPPNKGEKIRSFHLLRGIAERAEVHLFATADPPEDALLSATLEQWFASVHLFPIRLGIRKIASLTLLPTPWALTLPSFYSSALSRSLKRQATLTPPDVLLLESSSTGWYLRTLGDELPAVMDFVDVDSEKWRHYASVLRGPGKLVYAREAMTLRWAERRIANRCRHSAVTTAREAESLREIAPDADVVVVQNGVDTEFFTPPAAEGPRDPRGVVFFGAMDYAPNADAAVWFHENVLPALHQDHPALRFVIAGSKPTPEVRALASTGSGVTVTGFVDDIRPLVQGCDVCVIPLRVARGVQNKILEAMAMGLPVVCSRVAAKGIEGKTGDELVVADTPQEVTAAVLRLLNDEPERQAQAARGRAFVERAYSWAPASEKLYRLLLAAVTPASR